MTRRAVPPSAENAAQVDLELSMRMQFLICEWFLAASCANSSPPLSSLNCVVSEELMM